jgi:hypothetical protein
MPTPRKKNRKRKGKSGTPPTTPENGGKRQYHKFSPTTKLREPLISCVNSTCLSFMNRTRAKEEEEIGNSSAFCFKQVAAPSQQPSVNTLHSSEILSSYKPYSADTLKSATSFSVPSRSFCCSYTCAFAPVAMFYMMHLPRVTRKDNTVSNARKQGYLPPKRCQDKTASTQASMSNSLRQVFL